MLCHTRSSISKFLIDRQGSCWLASADRELYELAAIAAMPPMSRTMRQPAWPDTFVKLTSARIAASTVK
jgi:hypothetical protein